MTDRELLELAAKAAGIKLTFFGDGTPAIKDEDENIDPMWALMTTWNPLTDDGDALRLAVKLKMDLNFFDEEVACFGISGMVETSGEIYGDDPYAATRKCIVRAAAEIGKQLQS